MAFSTLHSRRRRGWTLVETVFVFSAETVVIGLCVGILLLVFQTHTKEGRGDPARWAAPRLAEQFRADVRAAEDVNLDGAVLTLTFPDDKEITYTIVLEDSPEATTRRKCELKREERNENEKPSREIYALPEDSEAWFEQGTGRYDGLMALHIWTKPVDHAGTEVAAMPAKENLNGFTREITGTSAVDPKFAANWRTIVARMKN